MKKYNCILLIDDDNINNFLNQRLLYKLNLARMVEVANNGEDGLSFIEKFGNNYGKQCPEIILLDINMPVMNGFEFLTEFKKMKFKNKDEIHVIMLTTSANETDMVRIKDYGMKNYIIKPLSKEKLERVLQNDLSFT